MIRINLLPTKAKEKARTLKNELIIGGVVIAVLFVFCWFVDRGVNKEIAEQKDKINDIKLKINEYQEDIRRVQEFRRKKADLQSKINAIKELDTRRSGPVKMMDEFTTILPKKMWITSFRESSKRLNLEGIATGGPVISDFLERLRSSRYFRGAQLIQTQQTSFRNKKMQKFSIVCQVKYSV